VFHFDGAAPVTITCAPPLPDLDVSFDATGTHRVASASPIGGVSVSFDESPPRQERGNASAGRTPVLQQ
jgi:hypothetical protein